MEGSLGMTVVLKFQNADDLVFGPKDLVYLIMYDPYSQQL